MWPEALRAGLRVHKAVSFELMWGIAGQAMAALAKHADSKLKTI